MSSEWKSESWIAASLDRQHRGRHTLLGIEKWIFRERSDYQEVAIAAVPDLGKALFLDAVIELAEADEFIYHESLALPPLLHHPAPKRVLIQGGGDGLALREVLRDPRVEEAVVVELDGLVVDACRAHLPDLHRGSFDDPRATVLVQDVFPYLESPPGSFDIILVDLLDGYDDVAVRLYEAVLALSRGALSPGGIIAGYGDLAAPRLAVRHLYRGLERRFAHVAMHRASIQSFGGEYGFVMAADDVSFRDVPGEVIQQRASALDGEIHALVPTAFPSCFGTPRYLIDALHRDPPASPALGDEFSWIAD